MNAPLLVVIAVAYLLGTFPSATLVGRLVGHDPTREGSRNPGATNMYRIAGRNAGAIVLAADFIKGALAAWIGLSVEGRVGALVAAIAVVIGHIFPVGRSFHGGKGVATLAGASAILWPLLSAGALLIWLVVVRFSRVSALGAIVAVPALALGVVVSGQGLFESLTAVGLATLIVVRHQRNIKDLLGRTDAVGSTSRDRHPPT